MTEQSHVGKFSTLTIPPALSNKNVHIQNTNRMKYCPGNFVNPVLSLLSRSQLNQQGNDLSRLAITVTIKSRREETITEQRCLLLALHRLYTDTNSPNDLIKELLEIMTIL